MKQIVVCGFCLLLSGCSGYSLSPRASHSYVGHEVCDRTGYSTHLVNAQCWIQSALTEELSLDRAIQIALLNNHKLKAIYYRLGISQADLVQAGLLENPIYAFSVRKMNWIDAATIVEMGAVQNILDLLMKPMKIRLAKTELEIVRREVTSSVIELIMDVKEAYFAAQSSRQSLMICSLLVDAADASYEGAKSLFQAGNVTQLFLEAQHASWDQAKVDYYLAEMDWVSARERLNVLMGLLGCQINWEIESELTPIVATDLCIESIERKAVVNSLDLQIARKKIKAEALATGIAVNEVMFPDISFGIDSEKDPGESWFVGPQGSVAVPIFDQGDAQKAAGRARFCALWNEAIALEIEIRSAARRAAMIVNLRSRQFQFLHETEIPKLDEVTQLTLQQVNAMQIGVFNLLEAYQTELRANIQQAQYYQEFWSAFVELESLLSGHMRSRQ